MFEDSYIEEHDDYEERAEYYRYMGVCEASDQSGQTADDGLPF